ncbi:MAG TPA: hypothetical protein GX739_00555 [Firmicutes bacterium]|nr:hypothetical protein [Bacillota bacterium]
MQVRIDLLTEWQIHQDEDLIRMEYPAPESSAGWYPIGFERGNDQALDAMGWYGLNLIVLTEQEQTQLLVKAHFADKQYLTSEVNLAGKGQHEFTIKPCDYAIERAKANIWRFLQAFEIEGGVEVLSAVFQRGKRIHVEAGIRGKWGRIGEEVSYKMTVYNCTDSDQSITVKQVFHGWESLIAKCEPASFVLRRGGQQPVEVTVKCHENMAPGAHEQTMIRFVSNGDSSSAVDVELITLRELEHPYIYHNQHGWEQRRKLVEKHAEFQTEYQKIIADADKWEVKPPVPLEERDYCYPTQEEHYVMSAAYAYAFTRERKYAEKVAQFFRYFTDPDIGYPVKKKGCSQSYVQEGHFFQHLAIPYDLIFDSGVLTGEDHQRIEETFRIYMDILDVHLQSGHISNWLVSEITGAVYCALAIGDLERALRFVFGPGGTIEQLRYGLFTDGWWYECSVSYNTWVASMMLHTAHALLPFGYNILHTYFPITCNDEVCSTYQGRAPQVRHAMYNKKWGGNVKNYVCIKDLFDAPLKFLDYRGVLFGINDSTERKLEAIHFSSTYDLAYTHYRDREYIPVIRNQQYRDPVFGHPQSELPEYESQYVKNNAYADNVGVVMLRSQTKGREQREQIQAVLRYGSHGFAHGHFDRTNLLSLMRYGRSFYNPEHVWWGYGHFMYKFYVQNSITKNIVVVDGKMQIPSDSKRTLFYGSEALQAAAVETKSQWAYPPYGGMVYDDNETLAERCEYVACSLPEVKDAPPYGDLSSFTEPIVQKRIMGVTDDYIVLFDYLKGEQEHQFDRLFQIKGFIGLESDGQVKYRQHTSQFNNNPLSDGQFITDCHWYEVSGNSVARFETVFGEDGDMRGTRSEHNCPGLLKLDVYTAWPQHTTAIIGRVAEDHGYKIPLEYKVEVDGVVKHKDRFGAWILGEGRCEIDVVGGKMLKLRVKNGPVYTEQMYPRRTKQGLFWGEAYIVTKGGEKISLSDLPLHYENIDRGHGIGKDYEGGRVTIVGNEYPKAIPTSPVNHDEEGVITVDLTRLDAEKFVGLIGADAFPGDELQRRKTYAVRTEGREGRFVTVVEPYEAEPVVQSVHGVSPDQVIVYLTDGRRQVITLENVETSSPGLRLEEYKNGKLVREVLAAGI